MRRRVRPFALPFYLARFLSHNKPEEGLVGAEGGTHGRGMSFLLCSIPNGVAKVAEVVFRWLVFAAPRFVSSGCLTASRFPIASAPNKFDNQPLGSASSQQIPPTGRACHPAFMCALLATGSLPSDLSPPLSRPMCRVHGRLVGRGSCLETCNLCCCFFFARLGHAGPRSNSVWISGLDSPSHLVSCIASSENPEASLKKKRIKKGACVFSSASSTVQSRDSGYFRALAVCLSTECWTELDHIFFV